MLQHKLNHTWTASLREEFALIALPEPSQAVARASRFNAAPPRGYERGGAHVITSFGQRDRAAHARARCRSESCLRICSDRLKRSVSYMLAQEQQIHKKSRLGREESAVSSMWHLHGVQTALMPADHASTRRDPRNDHMHSKATSLMLSEVQCPSSQHDDEIQRTVRVNQHCMKEWINSARDEGALGPCGVGHS